MKDKMQKLAEDLDKLEKLRKQTENAVIFSGALIAVLCIIFIIISTGSTVRGTDIVFMPFIYIAGGACAWLPIMIEKIRRRYKKLYNAVIVRNSLEQYFEIEEFNSDYGIPQSVINSTKMIRTGNNFAADDFIKGKYKDIFFMQSDVLMEDRAITNGIFKSKPITYFKGRWMVFEFNKSFKCDLLIYEKGFGISEAKFSLFSMNGYSKVEFENLSFNEHFNCYTDNEPEAFYVLTPHLIEAIESIRENTKGGLLMCFKNNMLQVGVNCGKWAFEPPIFSRIDVSKVRAEIDSDIRLITQFVDELKLDEKIYKID